MRSGCNFSETAGSFRDVLKFAWYFSRSKGNRTNKSMTVNLETSTREKHFQGQPQTYDVGRLHSRFVFLREVSNETQTLFCQPALILIVSKHCTYKIRHLYVFETAASRF